MNTRKIKITAPGILLITFLIFAFFGDHVSAAALILPSTGDIAYGSTQSAYMPWTRKEDVVQQFIALADAYGETYESIGKNLNGWDIVLFKFGNPNGGVVMVDAFLHGNEFYGYEVLYSVMNWLLTSNDAYAIRILQNNYILIVPCIDYRWGRTNYNVPGWMTTDDPAMDGGKCGVNLNRNFNPGWSSSLSTSDSDSYSGVAPDSESESQALIYAWNTYHPRIYWNLHQGASPMTQCGATSSQAKADANKVQSLLPTIQSQLGVSDGWSFSVGNGGGSYASDGAAYSGSAGFLSEVMSGWDNSDSKKADLDSGDTFKQVKAMFIAMSQAVEVVSPSPSPSPSPTPNPSPPPANSYQVLSSTGSILYQPVVSPNLEAGINYLSAGNRFADTDAQLDSDFSRFASDGIKHISMRLIWSTLEPTYDSQACNLDPTVLGNHKRVLAMAQKYGIGVNVDFWTHFQDVHWDMPSYISSIFDIVRNSTAKQLWLRYVSKVVTELNSYQSIESWAILNEPFYSSSSDKPLFQQLFADQVGIIKSIDSGRPVICRFTLSYTPGSGRFDESVYDLFDAFAVTEYLDPSNSSDTRYNGRWSYWDKTVADCKARNKPLWVIEFGDDNPDIEHVRQHYELSLQKFEADGVVKAYAWAWQTRNAASEAFNIYDGSAPKPAYYELAKYPA